MKYISICSGIEAATVAFHPLGFEPLAFSEIEPFPCAVLAYHYPSVPNLGDMTKYLDWPEALLADCDMLVGGPPCQAFSVAGLRNSLDDARGNLTLTYVKLIDHIDAIRNKHGKPPIIALYENVPGLLSVKDNAFGCLVGALCGQDAALETETGKWPTTGVFWGEKRRVGYRILDAQYFGVAQRRRRVFLLAIPHQLVEYFGDAACPSEILSIAESLRGDTPPSRKAGKEVADPAGTRTSNCGGLNRPAENANELDFCVVDGDQPGRPDLTGHIQNQLGAGVMQTARMTAFGEYSEDGTASTLKMRDYKDATDLVYALAGNTIGRAPKNGGNHTGYDDSGAAYTLTKTDVHAVAFTQNTRDEVRYINGDGQIAGALAAQPGMKQTTYLHTQAQVRRLTPVECARLQGFPDTYLDIQFRNKPAADGNKYKALGNSMAVPVMRYIGQRIKAVLDEPFNLDDLI